MWTPMTREGFEALYEEQQAELSDEERAVFERYRTSIEVGTVVRTAAIGPENVCLVCRHNGGCLYFDDVEYGFNISMLDENDNICNPGGSQFTLAEAVRCWMMTNESTSRAEPK